MRVTPTGERARHTNEARRIDIRDPAEIETDIHDRVGKGSNPPLDAGGDDVAEQADDVDRRAAVVGFTGNLEEGQEASCFH